MDLHVGYHGRSGIRYTPGEVAVIARAKFSARDSVSYTAALAAALAFPGSHQLPCMMSW